MSARTAPPGGAPPPTQAEVDGQVVELEPLALAVCSAYYEEFGDEDERYGEAGRQWCRHDNLYLLRWAIDDVVHGWVDLLEQARWLARVLGARNFPLERLARDFELAAGVVEGAGVLGAHAAGVAARLREAGSAVADAR